MLQTGMPTIGAMTLALFTGLAVGIVFSLGSSLRRHRRS